ncbi:MAG: sterol desaturase family protein [bacterium]|nr:sterol desaturase family protein [bacterium]
MSQYQVPNYIALAIPFFFLLIFIELVVTRYILKRDYYRISDSINDLSMGIVQQLTGIFIRTTIFAGYLLLYDFVFHNYRLIDWGLDGMIVGMIGGQALAEFSDAQVWGLVACSIVGFLLVDLAYYWFHRMSHQVAVIWGSHEAHHQSEEYNLTVALRQGFFQFAFSFPFYMPLAFLGIHPAIYLIASQFNTIYQFWIHTRAVKKMPRWIEAIWNTPSHHRVHHGIDPKYIDKNHAGTLIIWDKMFGTFQEEEEEPHYGTVKPLASWNPMWAQIQYWLHLFKTAYRAPHFTDKLKIWFMKPGWKPRGMGEMTPIPEVDPATYRKYDPQIPTGLSVYSLVQFSLVILVALTLLNRIVAPFSTTGGVIGAWVILSLVVIGILLEGRRFGFWLEAGRQALLLTAAAAVAIARPDLAVYALAAGLIGAAGIFWLSRYRLLIGQDAGHGPGAGHGHTGQVPTAAK